jgi:hypothetical protein
MNKNKPKIIEIRQDKQEEAQKILDSKWAHHSKTGAINQISGQCCICGKIAQKIVKYDITDADDDGKIFRVERYCNSCYQRWVVECKEDNDNTVKLLDTGQRNETIAVVEK